MVELARERGVDASRRRRAGAAVRGRRRSTSWWRRGCSTTFPTSLAGSPRSRASCARGDVSSRRRTRRFHLHELRELVGSGPSTLKFSRENGEEHLRHALRGRSERDRHRRRRSSSTDRAQRRGVRAAHRSRCRRSSRTFRRRSTSRSSLAVPTRSSSPERRRESHRRSRRRPGAVRDRGRTCAHVRRLYEETEGPRVHDVLRDSLRALAPDPTCSRSAAARASSPSGCGTSSAPRSRSSTSPSAWSSSRAPAASRRAGWRRPGAAVRGRVVRHVVAAWMLYHVPDVDRGARRDRACPRPGGSLVAVTNVGRPSRELRDLLGTSCRACERRSPARTGPSCSRRTSRRSSARTSRRVVTVRTIARSSSRYRTRCQVSVGRASRRGRAAVPRPWPNYGLRRDEMIRPAELIQRKRDGEELPDDELAELILGYARGEVPDYQMAAFCMAVLLPRPVAARDVRADRRDDPERRDDRHGRGARPEGRRQALDRRRRRQDVARGRRRSSPRAACRSGR